MKLDLGRSPLTSDGKTWNEDAIAAMTEWNRNIVDVQFSWSEESLTSGSGANLRNELFFSSKAYDLDWDSNTLALTVTWFDGNRRMESDIIFNSSAKWDSYRGPVRRNGSTVTADFRRVALHELGHVLGLGHPDQGGQSEVAVMNSIMSDIEALTEDDKIGAGNIYGYGPENKPTPPVVATPLPDQTVYADQTLTLVVDVLSKAPVKYQWLKDGVPIAGATAYKYFKPDLIADDEGFYSYIVSNPGGSTTSNSCKITVLHPPPPEVYGLYSPSAVVGSRAEIVANFYALAPPKIKWFKDGIEIPGATGTRLIFDPVSKSDAGLYHFTATNSGGSDTSEDAIFLVLDPTPPSATGYAKWIEMGTLTPSASIFPTLGGSEPLTIRWYKNGDRLNLETNRQLVVSRGAPGTVDEYSFIVTNAGGSLVSDPIRVRSLPVSPPFRGIAGQMYVAEGDPIVLGPGSYSQQGVTEYQWFHDGVLMPDAKESTYAIAAAHFGDTGVYALVATNDAGSTWNGPYEVKVFRPMLSTAGAPVNHAWIDSQIWGDTVYFLFDTPNRLERYDLVTKKWIQSIPLGASGTSFKVDAGGIAIVTGEGVTLLNLDGSNPTKLVTLSTPITCLMLTPQHVIVSTASEVRSYSRSSGAFLSSTPTFFALDSSGAYFPKSNAIFAPAAFFFSELEASVSVDGVVHFNPVQTTFASQPYYGLRHRQILANDGTRAVWSGGNIYDTLTFNKTGSLLEPFQDAVFAGKQLVALSGPRLLLYDASLKPTAEYFLSEGPVAGIAAYAGEVTLFTLPLSEGGTPSCRQISLGDFAELRPAAPNNPADLKVLSPEIQLDKNGVLLISDSQRQNLHRWSVLERKYLPSVGLNLPISLFTYSKSNNTVYYAAGGRQISKLSLDDGSDGLFTVARSPCDGLLSVGASVFVAQQGSSQTSYSLYDSNGVVVSTVDGRPPSLAFAWAPTKQKLYHFLGKALPVQLGLDMIVNENTFAGLYAGGEDRSGMENAFIRVSPDETMFIDGSGTVFGEFAQPQASLGVMIKDVAWQGSKMASMRNLGNSSVIELRNATDFKSQKTLQIPGVAQRLLPTPDGNFLAVTSVSDVLHYFVLDASLNLVFQSLQNSDVPMVTTSPISKTTDVGCTATFSIGVDSATPVSYQWYRDGFLIEGANGHTYTIASAETTDAGSYSAIVSNTSGMVKADAGVLSFSARPSVLANISTRSFVGNAEGSLIAGFVVQGDSPREFLIRASGPAMSPFGLSGLLGDPVLNVYSGQTVIAANDDWQEVDSDAVAISTASKVLGAFAWPDGGKDSAVLASLPPGQYTAVVSGKAGSGGVGLVEVYEVDRTGSAGRLINLSTRSLVRAGSDLQIAGLFLAGQTPKAILVRAAGPALGAFGVAGYLADPVVEVFNGPTKIFENDDWGKSVSTELDVIRAQSKVGAFPFASDSHDSAMILTLAPGSYTIQVRGKAEAEGVALVEVYELH